MDDAAIIRAVRDGTHTLVPRPIGDRKFYVGHYGDADIEPDALVLIIDLKQQQFEGEEMIGRMMGDLTDAGDGEWNAEDAKAGKYAHLSDTDDDSIPF
jgi:hypothetical protein